MSHTYKFDVAMSCGGCSGAIERVLKKLDGQFIHTPPSIHITPPFSPRSSHSATTSRSVELNDANVFANRS